MPRKVEQRRVEEHRRVAVQVGDPPIEGAVREENALAARKCGHHDRGVIVVDCGERGIGVCAVLGTRYSPS